jgi:hypothetical protein
MTTRVFLLFLFITSAVYADVQIHDGLISAEIQSEPLTQVLDRFRAQSDIKLLIDEGIAGKTISASFQNLPVASAFKKMLEGTGINYVVLAGTNGKPDSIFIGASSQPGTAPRSLDNRPVNGRGMVNPVNPPIPVPQAQPQPDARPQENKPYNPNVNIPTGGGFVPEIPKTDQPQDQEQQQQPQQQQQQQQEENPDDNSENN